MKKILVLVVAALALVGVGSASAQSRSSYFMEGSYFRNDLNPALAPTRGYVALPGIGGLGVNLSTNFLSVDNFVYQRDNELVTALHEKVAAEEFLGKLPSVGKMSMDVKTRIVSSGFYVKKMFWTFGVNANVSADMAMSTDMFRAVKSLGNGLFDLGNTAVDATAYMDVFIGTSFRVHETVNVGVKAKFLVGLMTMDGQFNQLSANVSPDVVSAAIDGTWRANCFILDNSNVKAGEPLDFESLVNPNISYMLSNFKNFGLALDLGAEARFLDDHLKVSAAITDLGFIKWGGRSHIAGTLNGDFAFKGVNFEAAEMDTEGNFSMGVKDASETTGYVSMVNFSVNAGVEYNILRNHIAFGLLSHTKFCNTMAYSELTASVNFRPTNWLSASVTQTFLNKQKLGVLGFALNIHPCAINIFAGVDFIDTSWISGPGSIPLPRYMKSVNAYVGVGFNLARPKFMRPAKNKAE